MKEIREYWPEELQEIKEFKTVSEIETPYLQRFHEAVENRIKDGFILSATEHGIKRREAIIGITPIPGELLEERRIAVLNQWNLKLPYTMRFFEEWLAGNVKRENFELALYPKEYRLELIIKGYSLSFMKQIKGSTGKIVPANLIFLLSGNHRDLVEIDIAEDARLSMRSEFYPRFNAEDLDLDGTWNLTGEKYLNGYDTEELLEFYPFITSLRADSRKEILVQAGADLHFQIKTENKTDANVWLNTESVVKTDRTLFVCLNAGIIKKVFLSETLKLCFPMTEVKTATDISMVLNAEWEVEEKGEASNGCLGSCQVFIGTQSFLTMEKDLWYLNGEYSLDGSKYFDAEIMEHGLLQ